MTQAASSMAGVGYLKATDEEHNASRHHEESLGFHKKEGLIDLIDGYVQGESLAKIRGRDLLDV